ncbi:MAG TPA: efflux RND transporter periplasmic adaptor subunit, partial [Chthoniobacterales bacterium]
MNAPTQRRSRLPLILTILACLGFAGALAFYKIHQFQQAAAAGAAFAIPPEAVTSLVVQEEEWQPTLNAIGSIQAVNGVTVSADLPGIVTEILFESGQTVQAGQILVKLDTRQEEAQFKAALAKRQLAALSLNRSKGLLTKQVSSQADFDAATAEFQQADALAQEYQAMIARKTIHAPFAGVLGIREVNVGQYLQSGDKVVPLQSLDPIYVNFSLPQQSLGDLAVGRKVEVAADGLNAQTFEGEINAINSVVDEATRNVRVQATLKNPGDKLRPGMYVKTQVNLPATEKSILIPASSISYAPYGNSVFVLEEMTHEQTKKTYRGARQQFVKIGASRGDQVTILSGLNPGEEIATSGVFKLRNGVEVSVDNQTQPSNNPRPTPNDT